MKKKAVGYVRISTTDQSNFSLDGQEEYIKNHCARGQVELLSIFRDDGQSAKNFDRANWRQLESYIKEHYREVDYLIVSKYDRFSRSVVDALAMIDRLEKKFGITVISVMESTGLHPDSPYFFQFRTQMLLGADVELRVIKDRTKFGMVQGAKSGRFLHSAPAGYKNARDDQDKPIILINEEKASLIRKAYSLFLQGVAMSDIARTLRKEGLSLNSHSAMQRMLTNPTYAGLIKVPAYYDSPEQLVQGMHPAIIEEKTWWKVQAMFQTDSVARPVYNDVVPLKGVLRCHCDQLLTAGNSKGKNRYYWYYSCSTHRAPSLNADRLHGQFQEILQEFSLPTHSLEELERRTVAKVKLSQVENEKRLVEIHRQIKEIGNKLEGIEEKYLYEGLAKDIYLKHRSRLESDRSGLLQATDDLQGTSGSFWAKYRQQLIQLADLRYLYDTASTENKQGLVRVVFDNKLRYEKGIYRTPYLLSVFLPKAALLKEKGLLIVEQSFEIFGGNPACAPNGTITEHLTKLMEWAASLRAA